MQPGNLLRRHAAVPSHHPSRWRQGRPVKLRRRWRWRRRRVKHRRYQASRRRWWRRWHRCAAFGSRVSALDSLALLRRAESKACQCDCGSLVGVDCDLVRSCRAGRCEAESGVLSQLAGGEQHPCLADRVRRHDAEGNARRGCGRSREPACASPPRCRRTGTGTRASAIACACSCSRSCPGRVL